MKRELLTYRDPKSPVSEVFRTLRTNIQFMNAKGKLKTLLVSSTFPEEGKSWITANLAVTFAQAGKKVILVDADMRKGRQYSIFEIPPKPGLSNYLSNMDENNMKTAEVKLKDYIQDTNIDNLHILVAGNVPPNPSELLISERMTELLKKLEMRYDLIIIDGTHCDLVADAIILSRMVDSTLVVAALKETKKDNLVRIVNNIKSVGGNVCGVVVNKIDISSKKYSQSYYYGTTALKEVKKRDAKMRIVKEKFSSVANKIKEIREQKKNKRMYEKIMAQGEQKVEQLKRKEEIRKEQARIEDLKKSFDKAKEEERIEKLKAKEAERMQEEAEKIRAKAERQKAEEERVKAEEEARIKSEKETIIRAEVEARTKAEADSKKIKTETEKMARTQKTENAKREAIAEKIENAEYENRVEIETKNKNIIDKSNNDMVKNDIDDLKDINLENERIKKAKKIMKQVDDYVQLELQKQERKY